MHNEEKFWLMFYSLVAVVVVIAIVSITVTLNYTTTKVAAAIERGVDPMSAKCALDIPAGDGKLLCANLRD